MYADCVNTLPVTQRSKAKQSTAKKKATAKSETVSFKQKKLQKQIKS